MISRDDGLCAMGYAPCSVRYRLSGRVRCGSMWKAIIPPAAACISRFIPYESGVPDSSAHSRMGKRRDRRRGWRDSPRTGGRFRHPQPRLAGWRRDSLTLPMAVADCRVPSGGERRARPAPLRLRAQTVEHEDTLSAEIGFGRCARRRGGNPRGGTHGRFRRACRPRRAGFRAGACAPPAATSRRLCSATPDVAKAFDAELVPYAEAVIRLAVLPVL